MQKQPIRMPVRPAEKIATIVRQSPVDSGTMLLEKRQHILVEHMHSSQRELAGVQTPPGVTAVAVDDGLQVNSPHALERPDKKRVHGDQIAGVVGFDVPVAEFSAETFQKTNLVVGKLEASQAHRFLQAHQAFVSGQQVVAAPGSPDARGIDPDSFEEAGPGPHEAGHESGWLGSSPE